MPGWRSPSETATSLLLYARSPCLEFHDFSSPSPLPPAPADGVYYHESAEETSCPPLSGTNTTPDLLLVNKRTPLSERNTTPFLIVRALKQVALSGSFCTIGAPSGKPPSQLKAFHGLSRP